MCESLAASYLGRTTKQHVARENVLVVFLPTPLQLVTFKLDRSLSFLTPPPSPAPRVVGHPANACLTLSPIPRIHINKGSCASVKAEKARSGVSSFVADAVAAFGHKTDFVVVIGEVLQVLKRLILPAAGVNGQGQMPLLALYRAAK